MRNKNASVSDPNEFVCNPGDLYKVLYDAKVMEDGKILLVENGKSSIKDEINSFKEQTDIAYIINQLQLGNTSVLNPKQPMYDDFTKAPADLRSAMQTIIDGEKEFYNLPLDLRQKFDNNFRFWLASAGSQDWLTRMNEYFNPVNDRPASDEKEVKE